MKKKLTTVAFRGTPEQEAALRAVIRKHAGEKGAMMPILQEAQEIYGYLPVEVQRIIALETGVSLEEIFGIASFYAQFKLNPDGQYSIAVCLGTACYVKGSGEIIEAISEQLGVPVGSTSSDGKYSIEATRCIGACGSVRRCSRIGRVRGFCRGLVIAAGNKRQHHNGNQSKSKKLSHFSSVFIPEFFGAALRGMNHVFIVTGSGASAQVIFSTNFATVCRAFYTDFTRLDFCTRKFSILACQAGFIMI